MVARSADSRSYWLDVPNQLFPTTALFKPAGIPVGLTWKQPVWILATKGDEGDLMLPAKLVTEQGGIVGDPPSEGIRRAD
jgi:hypothetical protein